MQIDRVLETCLYVKDLDQAEAFYTTVLGLERFAGVAGRHLFFRCGAAMLLLFNPEATVQPNGEVPTHGAHGAGHVAFAVAASAIDGWRERLAAQGVAIEQEIRWPSGGYSLYFRDPSGNSLELATPATWRLAE